MEDQKSNFQSILYSLFFAGFFMLATRYAVASRYLLLVLLALSALSLVVYYYWNHRKQSRGHQPRYPRGSVEATIQTRLYECDIQIEQNTQEIAEIEESMVELEQKLRVTKELPLHLKDDTEQLIESFRSQLKLRQSKLAFFETCKTKLEQLLHQHDLTQTLEAKKKKLKRLQENNYQDLAKIEEMRSHVEYDTLYLDTIENLSHKLKNSNTYTDVERLRAELDEMTQSLDRF